MLIVPTQWKDPAPRKLNPRLFPPRCAEHGGDSLTIQETRLSDELMKLAAAPDKLGWGIEFSDGTAIENDDPVRVNDGVNTMRNGDDRSVFENVAAQGALKQYVCLDINGRLDVSLLAVDPVTREIRSAPLLRPTLECCSGLEVHAPKRLAGAAPG